MDTNTYMPVMPAGNGDFGGNGAWWLILLFLFMGFGGGFGGGFNNNAAGFAGADIQRGFDQNSVMGGINGIQSTLTSSQMADLNRSFDVQTSILQGFNGIQAQLAQCCCDNKTATLQTQAVVQNEGNLTRLAIQQQTQAILDKMCQQEIDALKDKNMELQNRVNMLNLSASQTAQTAALIADNTAQTQYIVNRVAPYPIPSYTVANPNTPAA